MSFYFIPFLSDALERLYPVIVAFPGILHIYFSLQSVKGLGPVVQN